MKNCLEIQDQISRYLDNDLDIEMRIELEKHLEYCDSCRNEVEEIKRVINLCNNIYEEKLPDHFTEGLHSKLLLLKSEQSEKSNGNKNGILSRVISFNHRYIKIGTSIAAIAIIALIIRMGMNWNPTNFWATGSSPAENNAQAGNITADAGNIAFAERRDDAALNADQSKEAQNYNMKSLDNNGRKQESSDTDDNTPSSDNLDENTSASVTDTTSIKAKSVISVKEDSYTSIMSSDISVNVEDPALETEKIKLLVSSFDGEPSDISFDATDKNYFPNASQTTIRLAFKLPRSNYDMLLNSIKEDYGSEQVSIERIDTVYVNNKITDYEKEIKQLEKRIKNIKSGKVKGNIKELDRLEVQRDSKQKELYKIMQDTGSYTVVIYINKK